MARRPMLYDLVSEFSKASPAQTDAERRLIDAWLANPDNYEKMLRRKQEGSTFCDAPTSGIRAKYDAARLRANAKRRNA